MNNKRTQFIVIALIIQCIALGYIFLEREMVLLKGDTVFIRTEPVDPRDIFRGDYVRLNYEISRFSKEYVNNDEDFTVMQKSDRMVYLTYESDGDNIFKACKLSLKKPENEKFIRGFTSRNWSGNSINVRYSIEQYFMEQGKALKLQSGEFLQGVNIPLEMEVKVGKSNGICVLNGYRYSELGMGVLIERKKDTNEITSVKLKFANSTDNPIGIVIPEDLRTISLKVDSLVYNDKFKVKRIQESINGYNQEDIIIINPKSIYEMEVDIGKMGYKLFIGEKEISLNEMTWNEQLRMVYKTPDTNIKSESKEYKLWRGTLESPRFSGRNVLD